jgi:hypothetical protein
VAVGQIIVTIMPLVEGLEAKLIPFHDHFVWCLASRIVDKESARELPHYH